MIFAFLIVLALAACQPAEPTHLTITGDHNTVTITTMNALMATIPVSALP